MSYFSATHAYISGQSITFVIVSALISSLLIMTVGTNTSAVMPYFTDFMANAKSATTGSSSTHGGAVPLITLDSGNGELDHQVNQFFQCVKKTGHTGGTHGEPSRGEIDTCYETVFVSGDSSSSSFGTEHSHSHSHSQGHSHSHSQDHSTSNGDSQSSKDVFVS